MIYRTKAFLLDIYLKRSIIYELAKRDFQQQYMGSYLGFLWVFLQPLIFISILYMVFQFGFRAGSTTDIPFVLYLISGIIPWMYFSGNLGVNSNVLREYAYILHNSEFRNSVLPIVKILSAAVPHLFFIFLAVMIAWIHGFVPSVFTLQSFYYLLAMILLLLGLGWLTASTNLFVSDVSKIVSIITQFGFWMTPIFWNIKMIPLKYQWIIKLNPVFYIVRGYRDSLIYNIPFWHYPFETLYFWFVTLLVLFIGITIFGKLRPHFAEVI